MSSRIRNRTWAGLEPSNDGGESLLVLCSDTTNGVEYRVGPGEVADVLATEPVARGRITIQNDGCVSLDGSMAVYDEATGGLRMLENGAPRCMHAIDAGAPPSADVLPGPLLPRVDQPLAAVFSMTFEQPELRADPTEGSGFAINEDEDEPWSLFAYEDGVVVVCRWKHFRVADYRTGRYVRDGDRIAIRLDEIGADADMGVPASLDDCVKRGWIHGPPPLGRSISGLLSGSDTDGWSGLSWCGKSWTRGLSH